MRVMRRIAGSILQQTHILQTLKRLMGGGICLFLLIASLEVTAQTMPDVHGDIHSIVPDGSGGAFIGGMFYGFTPPGGNYTARSCAVAHILPNGSIDAAWNPTLSITLDNFSQPGVVYSLALSNGRLYIAGRFTEVNGAARHQLASVDAATGTLNAWNANNGQTTANYPSVQNMAFNMRVLPYNNKIFGAGTLFMPDERGYVGGFDALSGILSSWGSKVTSPFGFLAPKITALAVSNGVLYVGGQFLEIAGTSRRNLAAFDANTGDILPWNPGATAQWSWLPGLVTALSADNGQIYIAGHFSGLGGEARPSLGAVDANGTVTAWNPSPSIINVQNPSLSIPVIIATPQTVYVGGNFTNIGGAAKSGIAGLDPLSGAINTSTPELTTGSGLLPYVSAISVNAQGLIFGGNFLTVDGLPKYGLSGVAYPPTQPVSAINFSNPLPNGTGYTVSWIPPANAPTGYVVVAVEGTVAPTGVPQNGEAYSANALFTATPTPPFSGQVVFDGTGTSVNITGLIPNTNYTFLVYAYNGSGIARTYGASASATGRTNDITPPVAAIHPGIITVSSATINFGDVALNTSRTRRYTMYCANLTTANVTIAAPPQCEISVAGAPFSAAPVVFTTRATIDQVDIRVRFTPSVNGNLSGGITHTAGSTGATATLTGTSSPPSINASTLSLDFGAVVPSSTATRTYRVRYRNLASRSITLTPPPGFALSTTGTAPYSSAPLTVPTGVSGGFNVYAQFSPPNVGQINGNIGIANLDAPPLAVLVEGEGAYPRPGLAIQSLNFGDVPVGTCKLMSYVLTPAGPIDEQVTIICSNTFSDVEISTNGPNGPFSSGCQAIVFSRLAGVTSVRIWVRYCPTAVSDLNTTFSHTSQPGGQFVQLPITGRGVAPEITVLTPTINFGDVDLGSTAASVVRIRYRNVTPTGTITISTTASHPFLFDNLISGVRTNLVNFSTSATSSGATFSVRVTFAPTLAGLVRTTLSTVLVAPNGVTTASFTLIGRGIGASLTANNKRALDFGSQFLLVPRTLSFPLYYENITTNTITVTPPNHNNFLLMDPGTGVFSSTAGITLTVGGNPLSPATGTTTLTARFLPVQANGNPVLTFRSTVADGGIAATETLTLRGTGLVPMVNVTIGTIQFGQVDLGQVRYYRYTMTYRNITASTISIDIPVGSDFALAESSSGTWTTAGQRLSLTTVQPPTSATTTVSFWVRYTPTIAQATSIMVRHSSDGGDPRTVDGDNLVLAARKPSVLLSASVSGVHFGVIAANSASTQTFSLNYTNIGSPIVLTLPLGISARLVGSNAAFTARSFAFTPPAFSGSSAIEVQYSTTANATLNANISCTAFGTGATLVAVAGRAFTPQPTMTVPTNQLSFGIVVVNNSSTQNVSLMYQSITAPITVSLPAGISARLLSVGSFVSGTFSFTPTKTSDILSLEFRYAPTIVENLSGSIRITSPNTSPIVIAIDGRSTASPIFVASPPKIEGRVITSTTSQLGIFSYNLNLTNVILSTNHTLRVEVINSLGGISFRIDNAFATWSILNNNSSGGVVNRFVIFPSAVHNSNITIPIAVYVENANSSMPVLGTIRHTIFGPDNSVLRTLDVPIDVSFTPCPNRVDTITVLALYTDNARNQLARRQETIANIIERSNRTMPIVFNNSGINNLHVKFVNPEGEYVSDSELSGEGDNIARKIQFQLQKPGSRIYQLRQQWQADVICIFNHGQGINLLGEIVDNFIPVEDATAIPVFNPVFGAGVRVPTDNPGGNPNAHGNLPEALPYLILHEIGHICGGSHSAPATSTNSGSLLIDGGSGFEYSGKRVIFAGEEPREFVTGTMMFGGAGTFTGLGERIPYWSNPDIQVEVRNQERIGGVLTTVPALVRIGNTEQNMSRVMRINGQRLANLRTSSLNPSVSGPQQATAGQPVRFEAVICDGTLPLSFYQWTVRNFMTNELIQSSFDQQPFTFTMPNAPVLVRLIMRDANGLQNVFEQLVRVAPSVLLAEAKSTANFQAASSPEVLREEQESAYHFGLEQNYPNPFAKETYISFTLPKADHVRLIIYDALGREQVFVCNERLKAGRHTFSVAMPNLPSGVYSCRLQAGNNIAVRSMILTR